ncbi:hypothetical protein [Streptomyces sp. NPDC090022]|uniref:hypothetical protein n=1 Tax=Streptomyces sp. NPDC090022 TaxID=3365920 RepID=UPI00380FB01B
MTNLAPEAVGEAATAQRRPGSADGSPAASAPRGRAASWMSRRWVRALAEILVSVGAALGYTLLARHISVNPMNRIGQVSGLAKLQQYVAILALPLLALLLYTAYRGALRRHETVKRLVCAALAGLSTGVIAGGVVVALRGTPWPLGGQEGDPSVLIAMANSFLHGEGMSGIYPPGFPALMAAWAKIRYDGIGSSGFALHDMQIFFSALAGPMAYLAWRLLLRPFWALLIAVPAAVLFLDPIRPYSHVVMIVLLPLLAYFMREIRRSAGRSVRTALLRGAGLGLVFGILFLWYSGWYVWAAPGVFLLALFVFPWRGGAAARGRAGAYLGATVVTAGVVGAPLLYQMIRLGSQTPDRYAYLSVYADPAYVMGWASDRAGTLTYESWPVAGEMAGQSAFTLLLLLGVGLGIGLGLRSIVVRTTAAVLVGAWLARFWFASHMAHEKAVQLYPRTTWIIMYCLMILAVLGLMITVRRGSGWAERTLRRGGDAGAGAAPVVPRRVVQQLVAGLICVTALFATMGASWSVNRYMPAAEAANNSQDTMGIDAWRAHTIKKPDGTCPRFSPVKKCAEPIVQDWKPSADDGHIWCANVAAKDWPKVCGRRAPFEDPK